MKDEILPPGRPAAVLFDLDGTLLDVDVEGFFPTYFGLLSAWVAPFIPPESMMPRLNRAIKVMIADLDRSRTNQEVFLEEFFTGLDIRAEKLMPHFEAFYREEFPKLASLARPVPGAVELVEAVAASGRRLVVATSPVFPRPAIDERLRWAGVDHLHFDLVTTYENMHFCKPHPEYYAEIAEKLGLEPSACLMVGNDVEEDLPAQDVGMSVYLVEPHVIHRGRREAHPDRRGRLGELGAWLELAEASPEVAAGARAGSGPNSGSGVDGSS